MFGKKMWQVFTYELKRNIRRKGFLFTTFGLPLLAFALLIGYQFITSMNNDEEGAADTAPTFDFQGVQTVGYVDLSGTFTTTQGPLAERVVMYPDEAAAQTALQAGEIDVYYIIEPDYQATGNVTLNMPTFSLNQLSEGPIEELVYSQLAGDTDTQLLQRLRNPANIQEINPQRENSVQDEGSRLGMLYVFSITLMLGLFVTSGYLMQTVIEEKETHLIEILVSSVSPTQLLMGKILALGLMGLLQLVTWIVAIILLAKVAGDIGSTILFLTSLTIPFDILPIVLAYFVLGYLFFAAAFGAIGAISTSMQEGPQYAAIVSIPAAIPYYFLAIFLASPESTLPVVLSLFPITAPLSMIMRLSVSNVPTIQIIISLTLLVLSTLGMMWLAGRLFRVNSLLAGQVPRLRDIPRLIRG